MSDSLNKIPVSPITSFGNPSVPNGSTFGTNFSILQTGGYMEVYTLSGLTYTILSTPGINEYSGNSIPIQFTKGSGSVFSPDVLTLNSDNISSGRRKLGMLVYVYETDKIYQFKIKNYDTLWSNATGATGPGGPTVVMSDYGTTVKNNSAAGIALINAWTTSTISGVNGYNDTNASWAILQTQSITGGTFNHNEETLSLYNSIGGVITITGFTDVNVTGGTYSNGVATFTNSTGGTFSVTGFFTGNTDNYITGGTFNHNTETLSLINVTGGTIDITGFTDVNVTGGTYFQGNTTFTNSTGGTFNIFGPSNYDPGVISGETWTDNSNGSINLPQITVALFNNPNFFEPLKFYSIPSGTTGVGSIPALLNNDTNYVIVEYNNGSPRYNVLDNDGTVDWSSVILYMIIYRADNFVHILEFGNMGSGLSSKMNDRIISTDRFARESGCSLGLSGSTGIVTLSSGVVWNGPNRQIVNGVTSMGLFFKNYHSGGTWVYTTTAHTINNLYYDNGTNLVLATGGKYLVNWYFRGQELNDHLYEVVSSNQYDSVLGAEASNEPNLPELIISHAFLVGRIIIAVSATTGITQSAFTNVFQPSGASGIHNDLIGLQGGLPNEYYHLDSNKYNNLALTNTNNNFSVGQTFLSGLTATTITANNISGTTNYVSKFTGANSLGNSLIYDNGTNVGIGTTSPTFKLDVSGEVSATKYNASAVVLSTRSSKADLYGFTGPTLSYYNGTAIVPALTVLGTGYVGIGTTSPNYPLSVENTSEFLSTYKRTGGTSKLWGFGADNNSTYFKNLTDTVIAYTITNTGNVGIGTTSPNAKLDVQGSITAVTNLAKGVNVSNNLISAANNDALVGLDIAPNYVGGVGTTNTIVGGSSYTGTSYAGVPLTGGTGTGAIATVFINPSGVVSAVTITTAGSGYYLGNVLGTSGTTLGTVGSGFNLTINTLSTGTSVKPMGLRVDGIPIGRGGGYVSGNFAMGIDALRNNTIGINNIGIGLNTLLQNSNGSQNIAIGNYSLQNNQNSQNTSIGYASLISLSNGSANTSIGNNAGRYIANGSTPATNINNSIFIGLNAFPLADTQTNQIVIGTSSTGLGSNTTVLGNSSTITSAIYGNLLLGTTVDGGAKLQVSGTVTPTSTVARGASISPILTATANGDTLVGLDINPTFTTGALTGVTNAALRVSGNILPSANNLYSLGTNGTRFKDGYFNGTLVGVNFYASNLSFASTDLGIYNSIGNAIGKWFGTGNLALQAPSVTAPIDNGYRLDVSGTTRLNGQTRISGTTSAITNLAQGVIVNPTLIATANNDVLVGMDINTNYVGGVGSVNTIVGGSSYTGTSYTGVPLTGGTGTGAIATIFIGGGAVTAVTITTAGSGYYLGNVLGTSGTTLGTVGSGFNLTINTLSTGTGVKTMGLRVDGINIGRGGGYNNTNTAVGNGAGLTNTTGNQNTFIGYIAGLTNTTGVQNTALGASALYFNVGGNSNTAIGANTLSANVTGFQNTSIGSTSLSLLTSGANNISLGFTSGRYIADGTTSLLNSNTSIFIGDFTKALASSQTNQIVIGYNSTGLGSNTTVLGNSSTLTTAIYGDLLLGTTIDSGAEKLQVQGTAGMTAVKIIGSGNSTTPPIFTVQGSQGELFSVNDSLIGSLFSVNDISGLPILEVFSDNTVLMGSYIAPSLNTTTKVTAGVGLTSVYSIPTSAYTGAFFDYTISDNTNLRAGNVMAIWNSGTTVQYTETSTNDIGNTSGLTFNMIISGSTAILRTSGVTGNWTIKTIIRSI